MRRTPLALFAVAGLIGLVLLTLALLLPHERYLRWQAIRTEAFARLGWIYERIHYDPTPVDIAFIGTSHTMNGVDAAAVAEGLRVAGLAPAGGGCVQTANLSVPAYGRNLHWIVARELLTTRPVKTLVLEVLENETRKPHPIFWSVADLRDVFDAPVLININYLLDIARMPWRQLSLAVEGLAPSVFGLKDRFDPADYDGSNVDNTAVVNVGGQALTPLRDRVIDPARLAEAARGQAEAKRLNMLGERLEEWEYALPRTYVTKILDLAEARGVRVIFLYLPGYGKPPKPVDTRLYDGRGAMIEANDVLADRALWYDVDHLNAAGARRLGQRLVGLLGAALSGDPAWRAGEAPPPSGCAGLPNRPALKPFTPSAIPAAP